MDIVDTVLSILIMLILDTIVYSIHGNSVDPTSVFALPLLVIQ